MFVRMTGNLDRTAVSWCRLHNHNKAIRLTIHSEKNVVVDLLQAHHASWATAFSRGDLEAARTSAIEGMRLYEPGRHALMTPT